MVRAQTQLPLFETLAKYCVVAGVAVLREGRIIKGRSLDEVFAADILNQRLRAPWET